ncbi:beta strand repeat-containing protein [Clostridium oryzae]|uniref:Bacterial Ig-like domain protein n=1 Tax=Clostridium oryzae TaxID=1450648 RepID=A0A1V4IYP9_9CLOT|nr:Ig-like domain-containing protein [Clostridium oryzae]OPJ65066.1 bacterial Ig-like domain protein [Clostridium oryzae]
MNKNVEKTMSRALSATLALGVVSTAVPVSAKSATSYYNDAKKAVAKAKSSKTQSSVDAATKAIKTLKAKTKLDNTKKVKALEKTLKAAQTAVYSKVKSAVSKFKKSQNKADYNSAKKLVDALAKSTIKTVKSSAKTYQKSLDAARATVKSVAAVADKTVALGTTADKLGLPTTVNVTLSNGTTTTANVAWDTAKFDGTKAGDTAITGKLTVPSTKYYKATTLTASVKVTVSALEVTTVKADTAKSLQVTFNGPVADTSKVSFDVQKGDTTKTAVTGLTVTWNTEKTVATLAQESNLTATTYTVTAKGDNVSATKNSGTVKVEAQKVAKIEITSKQLVKVAPTGNPATSNSATFSYKVTDQYGTDITAKTAASTFSTSAVIGSTEATITLHPDKGTATVAKKGSTPAILDTDKTAVVTLVNTASGANATATLDVAAAASISDLTFGDDVLPTGKTRIETKLSTAVSFPITAKDQYGNTITDKDVLNNSIKIFKADNIGATLDSDANGKPIVVIDTKTYNTPAGTYVITIDNIATGKTWTKNFNVVDAPKAYSLTFGDFNKTTIADGDTDVSVPITVKDQFGNEMSKADIAGDAKNIEDHLSGDENLGQLVVDTDKNSKTYGMLVQSKSGNTTNKATKTAGNMLVSVLGGGTATKAYKVEDPRKVASVSKADAVTLTQGATAKLKFKFKDQYDSEIDVSKASYNNTDYTYKVDVTTVSGDKDGLTSSITTKTDVKDIYEIPVTAGKSVTGTYKVTVTILKGDSEVSVASTTVTVSKNNVSGLTYSVADIPTIYANATAGAAYTQKVNVSAKDAAGTSYVLNGEDVVDVKSDSAYLTPSYNSTDKTWSLTGSDWYDAGVSNPDKSTTKTAKITVQINTLDGIKTITKDVTLSNVKPSYTSLRAVTGTDALPRTDVSNYSDANYYNFATFGDNKAIKLIGKDQYGVWSAPATTDVNVVVNSTDNADKNALKYNADGTLSFDPAKASTVTANTELKVTLVSKGASAQITVKTPATAAAAAVTATPKHNAATEATTGTKQVSTLQISGTPAVGETITITYGTKTTANISIATTDTDSAIATNIGNALTTAGINNFTTSGTVITFTEPTAATNNADLLKVTGLTTPDANLVKAAVTTPGVASTPATPANDTLTIAGTAIADSTATVVYNNGTTQTTKTVDIKAGDNASTIATKIETAFSSANVKASGDVVTFANGATNSSVTFSVK